ncbi:MAG: DUF11 domain-containing protein [Patescibacteria group bacterium]|nr:DUF11 domain-containing protein [Patescibacteria group bacterium]
MKIKKFVKTTVAFAVLFGFGLFVAREVATLGVEADASGGVIEDSSNVFRAANITQGETEYSSEINAKPGEAIQFMAMVHLGAENTSAEDVRVRVDLDDSKIVANGKYELVAKTYINSSENDVRDSAKVVVPSNQDLVFIPEHGVIVTSNGNLPSNVSKTPYEWSNPDELFKDGVDLGSVESISTVYISFKAYVSNKTADMTISKEVANVTQADGKWHKSVWADAGDRVRFQIVVKNTGGSELNDVLITDSLPAGLTYIKGSSEYSTPYSNGFKKLADSWITGEGGVSQANLGKLSSGEGYNAIIVFDTRIDEKELEDCVTYTNVAQAKANEYPNWIYGEAAVDVCFEKEEKVTDLEIEKFVKWEDTDDWYESIDKDTHLFDPEELVEYKIVVRNKGNADAHNVTVKDEAPTYISWEKGDGDWDSDNRKIKFDLGTVKAGEEISLDYISKVFDEEDLPFTDRMQKNVATLYEDSDRIDDDHTQVWINGPEIKAAKVEREVKELPEAGADSLGLLLIAVGMVITGWGLRKCSWAWSRKIR